MLLVDPSGLFFHGRVRSLFGSVLGAATAVGSYCGQSFDSAFHCAERVEIGVLGTGLVFLGVGITVAGCTAGALTTVGVVFVCTVFVVSGGTVVTGGLLLIDIAVNGEDLEFARLFEVRGGENNTD